MKKTIIVSCAKCSKAFNIIAQSGFICPQCGFLNSLTIASVDDINGVNYFNYLMLSSPFNINLSLLENNFLHLIELYHPDRYVTKSIAEQIYALHHTSYLNTAYNCLQNFMKLFEYLYSLHNNEELISEEDGTSTLMAMEFLEVYEELDSIKNLGERDLFISTLKAKFANLITELNNTDIKQKQVIKPLFFRMKYLDTIVNKAYKIQF